MHDDPDHASLPQDLRPVADDEIDAVEAQARVLAVLQARAQRDLGDVHPSRPAPLRRGDG